MRGARPPKIDFPACDSSPRGRSKKFYRARSCQHGAILSRKNAAFRFSFSPKMSTVRKHNRGNSSPTASGSVLAQVSGGFPRMAYKIAARPLNAYKSRLAASLREFSARQVKNYPKRIQNDSRAILGGLRGYFVGGIFPPVRRRAQFPAARGSKHMREGAASASRSRARRPIDNAPPASRFLPLGFLRRGRPFV